MMNSQRIMGGVPSGNSTSSTLYNRGLGHDRCVCQWTRNLCLSSHPSRRHTYSQEMPSFKTLLFLDLMWNFPHVSLRGQNSLLHVSGQSGIPQLDYPLYSPDMELSTFHCFRKSSEGQMESLLRVDKRTRNVS